MKLTRKFVMLVTCGCLCLLIGGWIAFCTDLSGIKRTEMPEDPQTRLLIREIGEPRVRILYLASLAPSPHNTQPWKVTIIDKNRWIISLDPSRQMKSTDPSRHAMLIAAGAFLENLSLAAGAAGYEAHIEITADDFLADDIATVTLTGIEVRPYPVGRITSRKTVKNGFLDTALRDDHLMKLSEPLSGHFYYFPIKTRHGECIRNGAAASFQAWLDSSTAQQEHIAWLRMTNARALQERDGLTTDGMEIEGISGWCIRTFMPEKSWAGTFMKKESMKFTVKTSKEGSGYVIITGYGNDVRGMIETGRRFERMALLAREFGIGIHPMTQMLEMESGHAIIASNHRRAVAPRLILRIGYVKEYPQPVSLRRPVGWFASMGKTAR